MVDYHSSILYCKLSSAMSREMGVDFCTIPSMYLYIDTAEDRRTA